MNSKILFFNFLIVAVLSFASKAYSQGSILNFATTSRYCFKTAHVSPLLEYQYNKHALYIGPDFVFILKPLGDPANSYQSKGIGTQFGYNYYFFEKGKFHLGFNFHFSIYNQKGKYFSISESKEFKRQVVANSLSFSVNYTFLPKFTGCLGLGLNSYQGFFLMLEQCTPSCFVGIKYRIF